jgi:hypothetical protein
MKDASDSAFVVSVHYESLENATRINLKRKGHHEISISDFDFDHPGEVIGCGMETENARWVIVQFSQDLHVPNLPPESQFAPVILQSHDVVRVGDLIRLRRSSRH